MYPLGQHQIMCDAFIHSLVNHIRNRGLRLLGNTLEILAGLHQIIDLYYYCKDACRFQEEICTHWDTAYQLLRTRYLPQRPRSEWPQDHVVDAVLMTGMLADLARLRFSDAADKAELLVQMLNQTRMPFYEAKMRLALSTYYLMQSCQNFQRITEEVP